MSNNTLLNDNFFNIIDELLKRKSHFLNTPQSFDQIDENILKEIIEIDKLYQALVISQDEAFDIIVDLLMYQDAYNRDNEAIQTHLRTIRQAINKLIEEFKKGKITKEEFLRKYQILHNKRLYLFKKLYELEDDFYNSRSK